MLLSALLRAKRAFVSVLLATASTFGLVLNVTRDSEDKALTAAYRKVAKKAHPDKGGCTRSFQKLQGAREAWDAAREKEVPSGRPESRDGSHGGLVTLPTKTEDARGVPCAWSGSTSHVLWRLVFGSVARVPHFCAWSLAGLVCPALVCDFGEKLSWETSRALGFTVQVFCGQGGQVLLLERAQP